MSDITVNEAIKILKGKIASIPQIDKTLTKEGSAADAKEVGDRLLAVSPEYAKNVKFDNSGSWSLQTDVQGALGDALKQTEVYENGGYMQNHWSGENNYIVVGKICILNFNIQNGLSPASANAVFVTDLPKPQKTVAFVGWRYDNDYTFEIMPCGITTNGELCIHKELTYQHSIAGSVAYQIA